MEWPDHPQGGTGDQLIPSPLRTAEHKVVRKDVVSHLGSAEQCTTPRWQSTRSPALRPQNDEQRTDRLRGPACEPADRDQAGAFEERRPLR